MKKKQLSKALSLLLAGTMILGLAACGAKEQPESSEEPSKVQESEANTQESTETEPEVFEVTYPIDTDVTFKFVTTDGGYKSSEIDSFDDSPYHQNLEKLTGIDVEWEFVSGGSKSISLLLAYEDEAPDVFNTAWFNGTTLVSDWVDEGLLTDLTDYLPIYAPDFWERINSPEYETTKRMITDDEGRFYYIPFLSENHYISTYQGPIIRQDWLDECGLDVPVTIDEFENVLITFKEKYGATLGGNMGAFNNAGVASGTGAMSSMKAALYIDDNGKVQCANVQPEWKELMTYINKWYEMELIDVDFFNTNGTMQRQKALDGDIGVIFVAQSQMSNILNDAAEAGNGAEWVPMEYLRTAAGEPTSFIQTQNSLYANDSATFISSTCPEELIPVILQWVNYGYTEEGMTFINYGVEGETYTKDASGNIQWTEVITEDPVGVSAAMLKYCGAMAGLPGVKAEGMVRLRNVELAAKAVDLWIANTEVHDHIMPTMVLNWEESIIYTDKWSTISTYIGECATKFFTGELSLDEWDNYVKELENMGLQDVLDVQQSAYDRFISK